MYISMYNMIWGQLTNYTGADAGKGTMRGWELAWPSGITSQLINLAAIAIARDGGRYMYFVAWVSELLPRQQPMRAL